LDFEAIAPTRVSNPVRTGRVGPFFVLQLKSFHAQLPIRVVEWSQDRRLRFASSRNGLVFGRVSVGKRSIRLGTQYSDHFVVGWRSASVNRPAIHRSLGFRCLTIAQETGAAPGFS